MKIREHLRLSISIIVFILICLSIPYLSYTGAFTFDETLTEPLDANFTENGIIKLTFADNVTSFKLSGEGAGAVWLRTGSARLLVFNSTNSRLLNNVCEETCNFNGGKTAELEVIVTEGIITLTSISYDIKIVDEAPVWIGRITNFTLQIGKPLVIDLDDYFEDPEGKNLTYLVTENNYFTASLDRNMLTITPASSSFLNK